MCRMAESSEPCGIRRIFFALGTRRLCTDGGSAADGSDSKTATDAEIHYRFQCDCTALARQTTCTTFASGRGCQRPWIAVQLACALRRRVRPQRLQCRSPSGVPTGLAGDLATPRTPSARSNTNPIQGGPTSRAIQHSTVTIDVHEQFT